MNKDSVENLERQISALKSDKKNLHRNIGRINALEIRLRTAKTHVIKTHREHQH